MIICCCCWDFPLTSANFAQETNVAERHISRFHWHQKNVQFHLKNNIEKTQKKTHSFTSHKVVPAPATNWFTTPWTSTIYHPSTQHISYKTISLMTPGTTKIEDILHQLVVTFPFSNPTIPVFHRNPGIPSAGFLPQSARSPRRSGIGR